MADETTKVTEKVYCYDHPSAYNNGNSATAAMAAMCGAMANNRNGNDEAMTAAMMNGMGNQWNNPFVYLVWMMFARKMWGDDDSKVQSAEIQNQLAAMRSQMQDNQNSNLLMDAIKGNATAIGQLANNLNCDFNTLNSSICAVRSGISELSGQVGLSGERVINAVQSGDASIVSALQNCCCQTQQSILKMGYENQLQNANQTNTLQNGQRDLGQAITQGFSATAYETQKQTCDIINAGAQNTQRIIDTLNIHWQQDLQQRYNDARLELSQQRQNAALIAALKTSSTTTTTTT